MEEELRWVPVEVERVVCKQMCPQLHSKSLFPVSTLLYHHCPQIQIIQLRLVWAVVVEATVVIRQLWEREYLLLPPVEVQEQVQVRGQRVGAEEERQTIHL